jgi:LysR family hydrogen peroxide-inducible transcriptional activator
MKPLPTLRQLRYLVALADHRHFGRAAEDCLVTQSTLSAGIQELEMVLDVTLVDRNRRQVGLTPLGEEIVDRARALLLAAEELADIAQSGRHPLHGLLRLGVIPTIGPYLLPPALPTVRARYPGLKLYLREDQTARLLALIGRGRLDAAVIALPYDTSGLDSAVIGADRLFIACPQSHRFAGCDRITPAELRGERLLLLEDGHCLREHALTTCQLAPGRSNEDLQGTSLGTLVQMVASGLGVTLLPEIALAVEARHEPDIAVVAIGDGVPARDIALVWRAGSARTRDLRLLADLLREGYAGHRPAPAAH